jgi:hypothetical protein
MRIKIPLIKDQAQILNQSNVTAVSLRNEIINKLVAAAVLLLVSFSIYSCCSPPLPPLSSFAPPIHRFNSILLSLFSQLELYCFSIFGSLLFFTSILQGVEYLFGVLPIVHIS